MFRDIFSLVTIGAMLATLVAWMGIQVKINKALLKRLREAETDIESLRNWLQVLHEDSLRRNGAPISGPDWDDSDIEDI